VPNIKEKDAVLDYMTDGSAGTVGPGRKSAKKTNLIFND